jgi:hypothetical protein
MASLSLRVDQLVARQVAELGTGNWPSDPCSIHRGQGCEDAAMSDVDSLPDSAAAGDDNGDGNSQTGEQTTGETTAQQPEPEDRSSDDARVNGLMAVVGRKETERQAALAERDQALALVEQMRAALNANNEQNGESYVEAQAAPTGQPVAADSEDDDDVTGERYPSVVTPNMERMGFAPTSPRRSTQPRSTQDAELDAMRKLFEDHVRLNQ